MHVPSESKICVVLVKPASALHRRIDSSLPVFCIYEHDRCFSGFEIRFGDGSGMTIDRDDHDDLVEVAGVRPDSLWH